MTISGCPFNLRKRGVGGGGGGEASTRPREASKQKAEEKGREQGRQMFLSPQSHTYHAQTWF